MGNSAPVIRAWRFLIPLLLVAVGLGALGASRLGRLQERRRLQREELTRLETQAAALRDALGALAARHPELDLGPEARRIAELAGASPSSLERRRSALREAAEGFAALELRLLQETTGLVPQDEQWALARRYGSFSAAGFKDLQDRLPFPDTEPFAAAPAITGQEAADQRLAALAEARGYRLRRQVREAALAGAAPSSGRALHSGALAAWQRLQAAAAAEGIALELVSGYRSVERQRGIFLAQLREAGERAMGRPFRPEEIAAGAADPEVQAILAHSSIPGYSKHHSGCALDLTDPSSGLDYTEFARTPAFAWLSGHNYLNAKRFGFVPSYPAGAPAQGPDPEPWEFLWVGEPALLRRAGTGPGP